jgi:hypothetical protein
MVAPGRLLESIRDLRIIAAAVANATTALTNGLNAANQNSVFMLLSQACEDRHFRKFRNIVARRITRMKRMVRNQNKRMAKTKMTGVVLMAVPSSATCGDGAAPAMSPPKGSPCFEAPRHNQPLERFT